MTPALGLPDPPSELVVVRGDRSITVTFTGGGGDPTGHEVSVDGGVTWTALPADGVVAGLTNGTVYPLLQVEARRYRFLMLNACNARFLNLNMLSAGLTPTTPATPVCSMKPRPPCT